MIAYKVFNKVGDKLFPIWMREDISCDFEPYDPGYIILRADNCGPFACFTNYSDASSFALLIGFQLSIDKKVIHKVAILKSRDKSLWVGFDKMIGVCVLPPGTVLVDEFEILERMK